MRGGTSAVADKQANSPRGKVAGAQQKQVHKV